MFKINDYVRYGEKGIFQIEEVTKRKSQNNKKEDWYVLRSHINGVDTKILTPVKNATLRPLMSEKEIHHLIDDISSQQSIWDENKRTRDDLFKSIIVSGKMSELTQMIKSIQATREEKLLIGKDISVRDKEFLKIAETFLFEEISISCNIKQDKVLDFIMSKTH